MLSVTEGTHEEPGSLVDRVQSFSSIPTFEQLKGGTKGGLGREFLFMYMLQFQRERLTGKHETIHQIGALETIESFLGEPLPLEYEGAIISHDDAEIARNLEEVPLIVGMINDLFKEGHANNVKDLANVYGIILKVLGKKVGKSYDSFRDIRGRFKRIEKIVLEFPKDDIKYEELINKIKSVFRGSRYKIVDSFMAEFDTFKNASISKQFLLEKSSVYSLILFEGLKQKHLLKLDKYYEEKLTANLGSKRKNFFGYLKKRFRIFEIHSEESTVLQEFREYFRNIYQKGLNIDEFKSQLEKVAPKYFANLRNLIKGINYKEFNDEQEMLSRYGVRGDNYTLLDHIAIKAYGELYIPQVFSNKVAMLAKAADSINNFRTFPEDIFKQHKLIRKGEALIDYWKMFQENNDVDPLISRVYGFAQQEFLEGIRQARDGLRKRTDESYRAHEKYLTDELGRLEKKYDLKEGLFKKAGKRVGDVFGEALRVVHIL